MDFKGTLRNKKLMIGITAAIVVIAISVILLFVINNLSNKNSLSNRSEDNTSNSIDSSLTNTEILDLENLGELDIVPLIADSTGVDLHSGFKIVSENKISPSLFQKALTISPQQEYKIEQISDRELHINFSDALKPDSIYRFTLTSRASNNTLGSIASGNSTSNVEDSADDTSTNEFSVSPTNYSWAFQTKKSFALIRTTPRNGSTYVPIDSGIELTFSHEGVKNIEQYFEISPKVNGIFTYNHKTVIFMPENLEYSTIYTVTVKKGLGLAGSDETLNEDYIFTFETRQSPEQEASEYLRFNEILYNFTPDTEPILDLYASQDFENQELSVYVYKYSNEDDLIKNLKQYDTPAYRTFGRSSHIKFDETNLQKVTEFNTKLMAKSNNFWYGSFLIFPSTLPEGHYLVNVKSQNAVYQTHVQVNDLSVYVMAGDQESLVWVNSSSTGQPVEDAVVSIVSSIDENTSTAKTDKDGIAIIPGNVYKDETDRDNRNSLSYGGYYSQQILYFKISGKEGPVFVSPLTYSSYQDHRYSGTEAAQKYWSYFYTDRGLYLPTDIIQIWGIVRPRSESSIPSKATLYLHRTDYYFYEGYTRQDAIVSKEIDISDIGTFISSMELTNFNPGSYYIQLKVGDEAIIEKYFEVRQYTKPAYKIDITPDKKVMFEWEKLNMDIQASFFEGSPVSGLELNYSHFTTWESRKEGKLTCDDSGNASLEISPLTYTNSWHPLYFNFSINNAKAEEEDIYAHSSAIVFPRDTMIEVNFFASKDKTKELDGQTAHLEINTSLVTLDKLKNQTDPWYNWYNPDSYRGNTTDIPLRIRIYEQRWEREETGQYYDFINKKVQKTYRYYEVKTLVKEYDARTNQGKYSYTFPIEENKNYTVEVDGTDTRGYYILETAYLNIYPYPNDSNIDTYSITTDDNTYNFRPGDTVNINVNRNGLEFPLTSNNRFLYMILKGGILSYTIESDADYSFNFTEDYIPNIYIKALYFDGKNILDVQSRPIFYDYKEKELPIDIKTDKQEYKPGDTVELEVEVRDANGNPSRAEVNLSVVDESFFAIQDQQVDTLASLYRYSFTSGILAEYLSYKPIDINIGSPEYGGEGGDQSIRQLFKDNACFAVIKTDSNGKGKTSFKVPDNLTSWRITYQAVTDDLKAGSGKINIPVRLPFFVDVIFNNIFMDGDTVCVSARSFGTELAGDENVKYTVLLEKKDTLDGNSIIDSKTFSSEGKGNGMVNIDMGRLEEGSYSVTVKAEHGKYSDALKRDFKVVKSMLEAAKSKQYKLTDNVDIATDISIAGNGSLTTLTFYNEGSSTYYNSLLSLLHTWGERVDQKLSRKIANELIKKYYGEDLSWTQGTSQDISEYEFNSYQLYDGGIALFTYDSSNPEVTAKISSLSKAISNLIFDSTAMKGYFYRTLADSQAAPEDVAASLWGLASLNDPVLIDILNLLKINDNAANNVATTTVSDSQSGNPPDNQFNNQSDIQFEIGLKEKLYLALGLAELGSMKEAKAVYDDIIKEYGITSSPYLYINSKSSRDDTIELTSLCSVLAAHINAPEKEALFKYVQDNSTYTILTNLERLIYLSYITPDTKQNGSFTVDINGRRQDVILEKNEIFKLILTHEALKKIKFTNIQGDIAVTASYTGPVKDYIEDINSMVTLKRSYSIDGITKSSFSQSDVVKITLYPEFSENAPDGYYEITDILPSGMRYVSTANYFDERWYPLERSGQKVVFGFYYNKNIKHLLRSITYYARAVTPGWFTADYAFVKHSESDASGFADRVQIEITK